MSEKPEVHRVFRFVFKCGVGAAPTLETILDSIIVFQKSPIIKALRSKCFYCWSNQGDLIWLDSTTPNTNTQTSSMPTPIAPRI